VVVRVTAAGRVGVETETGSATLGGLGRIAFAYLVCARHRPVPRDELAEVLWGEDLPASWEQLLRGLSSKIRSAVTQAGLDGTTFLTSSFGALHVHLPPGSVVDIEQAEAAIETARAALAEGDAPHARARASEAVVVAGRQFLPGGAGTWVERRQAELRELHLQALEIVSRAATAEGQMGDAVMAAEEAITIEPFRESAYVALMAAHERAGSRGEALRAYERCRRVLAEELGVRPSAQTEEGYQALLGEEPLSAVPTAVLGLPVAIAGAPAGIFVGREPEVDCLQAALKRATVEGRQAVFVAGEPGIGKTALVAAFATDAHAGGARVLYGRCDEELGIPYQPFTEALSHFVAEASVAELEAHVGVHGGALGRLVRGLTRRVPQAPPPEVADPEADRYRLFDAIASLFGNASRGAPLVLVLDDLHWAAAPTLSLLRHVLRATTTEKILVIGTYRHTDIGPEDSLTRTLADLRREPGVDRVLLEGLDEEGVAAFVNAVRWEPVGDDDRALARALHAHTAGNPFFVGELLRHLGETGGTYRREGTWSYYAGTGGLGIPEGVREVVARRLLRLSDPAREILRWASIIGADFDLELLELVAASEDPDEVLDAIEEAVRARLVLERGAGHYGFAHALVRDTIQAELTATRRARRHRAVAEALESLPGDEARRLPALVHHFAEAASAGGATKAADYAIAAARQAFAQSAWEDAVAFLERGLESLAALEPPDLERRCDLLLMLAETWCRFWDVPNLSSASEQAVEIARALRSPDRLARAVRWNLTASLRSDPARCRELGHEALTVLGDDSPALRALVLARLAPFTQDEAITREALELARQSGDSEALGVALRARSMALAETERAEERLTIAEELVSAAPPGGWDGWRGGYEQRAVARLVMGDRKGFEADADATARLGTERRFWYYQRIGALWQATLALLDGRFEDVEAFAAAANFPGDRKRSAGSSGPVSDLYAIQVSKLALERGQSERAVDVLTSVLARMPQHGLLRAMVASARAGMGEMEEARREFQRVGNGQALRFMPATLAYLSEVAATLRDPALVAPIYDRLRPLSGLVVASGQVAHCPGAVDRYLGQLAATLERWEEAEARYEIAVRVEESLCAPPLLARTRYWYGRMLVERTGTTERARADDLLSASFGTAETLGMAALARDAQELLGRP
jgi:DNA-binding SARP family transcriptional activator/tetratricopeptide (TPR) repeat protein